MSLNTLRLRKTTRNWAQIAMKGQWPICKSFRPTANPKTFRCKVRLSNYLLAALTAASLCSGQVRDSTPGDNVSFQILTDKLVYSSYSKMFVKFLIANTGSDSLYVHRSINSCGSLYGYYELHILDSKGLNVKKWECSGEDVWPGMQIVDPVSELRNPDWIELRPGYIFGFQEEVDVPAVGGVYRVTAELVPPRNFSAHQKEVLVQKQMRILNNHHQAQFVSIRVK